MAAIGCGGSGGCPGGGKGGSWRCLNGVTPQWCSVGGGPNSGGDVPSIGDIVDTTPNTYTWESLPDCQAPSTCVVLPDSRLPQQAVCSLTKSPAHECQGSTTDQGICYGDIPADCSEGYPLVSTVAHCPNVCIEGICSLSTELDPNCPDSGARSNFYCGPRGPSACQDGYQLDPAVYGPFQVAGPCPAGGDDGGAGDEGHP
jgi:hypothetical protein